jgi:guanine deaminase
MEKKQEQWMKEAIRLALENVTSGNGGPFAAIVVKGGEIIGRGVNTVTTSNDPTAHAEVNAIRNACKNLNSFQLDQCEIYTSCEPCPMCLGAIYWARPSKVFYASTKNDAAEAGFDDSFIYEEIEKIGDKRSIPFIALPMNEAKEVFNAWVNKQDKTAY